MVDLVKIRKKAKKGEAAEPEPERVASRESRVGEEPPQPPVAQGPAPAAPPPETGNRKPETERRTTDNEQRTSKLDAFLAEAGTRRGSVTASATEDAENRLELLTFVLAHEHYAVDIEKIVEIVTPRPITRVPNAQAGIVGIMSLRGTIVTLVDVRRKLRHPAAAEATEDTRIVVVDLGGETIGFAVDRVLRVVKVTAAEVEPHPIVHLSEQDESIRGVFRHAGALTILLDLDKLLAR